MEITIVELGHIRGKERSFCFCFCFFNFILFNFTILYWFCHISKWICHRYTCVPHPEPYSLLPPHTIPLGRPSAPAPSIQYRASNLDNFQLYTARLSISECSVENRSALKLLLFLMTLGKFLVDWLQVISFVMWKKTVWIIKVSIWNYCSVSHGIWRRKWQPTPVLLPRKSHRRMSLVGCSPWGR